MSVRRQPPGFSSLRVAASGLALLATLGGLPGCDYFGSPAARLAKARADLDAGNAPLAIADTKKILERDSHQPQAWLILADAAFLQNDRGTAETSVDKAREMGATPAELAEREWQLYRLRGDFGGLLKAVLAADPSVPALTRARFEGQALLALKRPQEALAAFQRARDLSPDNADAVVGAASAQLALGQTEACVKTLQDGMSAHPKEVRYPLALGQAYMAQGKAAAAAPLFTQAAHMTSPQADAPTWVLAQAGVAQAYLALGKYPEAKQAVHDLKQAGSGLVVTKLLQARVAIAENRLSDAAAFSLAVIAAIPSDVQAHMLLAYATSQQGYNQQAETSLNAVLQDHPDYLPARKLLAEIQLNTNRLESAQRILEPTLGGDADPEVLVLAARISDAQGRPKEADVYFARALAATGTTDDLRYRIATLYLRSGRNERATELLKSLPGGSELARKRDLLLALTDTQDGKGGNGAKALDEVAARYASDLTMQRTVAQLHASRGDLDAARTQLNGILKAHPGDVDTLLALANVENGAKHLEAAEAALHQILAANPRNVAAILGLAHLASERGDTDGAIKQLEAARVADPKAIEPRLALARLYLARPTDKGQNADAPALAQGPLKEALALNPRQPDAVLLAAELYRRQGRVEDAKSLIKDAATTAASSAPLWLELAKLQASSKELVKAYDSLNQCMASRPGWLPAVKVIAELHLAEGEPERALEAIRRVRTVPGQGAAEALNQRAGSLALEGEVQAAVAAKDPASAARRMAEAASLFSQAYTAVPTYAAALRTLQTRYGAHLPEADAALVNWLGLHPGDSTARGTLAAYYGSTGNRAKAIETYEVAVQAGSITALQLNNLAWLYYENKDTRALPTARQALELSGRQADVLDTLGWILVQQSKLNEGLPYLEEAFRGNNRQPEIAYHLAYAQAHSGKPVPARALLASLLSTPTAFPSRKEAEALLASLKAAGH